MKSEDDLTFSSEVAETLGIECSVILSLYKKNELNIEGKGNILIKDTDDYFDYKLSKDNKLYIIIYI